MKSLALRSDLLFLPLLSVLLLVTTNVVKAQQQQQQLLPDGFPELPEGHPGGHPFPKLMNALDEEEQEDMDDQYENWIKKFANNNNNNNKLRLETTERQADNNRPDLKTLFFFGNSFTTYNTFPLQVGTMYGEATGNHKAHLPRNAPGGATISNHYLWLNNQEDDQGNKLYEFGTFGEGKEWLIVQDQSGAPAIPDWRFSNNFYWERMLDFFAKDDTIVLWQTWGYRYGFDAEGVRYDFPSMNAALLEGYLQYLNIARSKGYTNTWLAPCGLTFETIYQDCLEKGLDKEDENCMWNKLYKGDGYHPDFPGSYACAMTIVSSMTGMSPFDFEYNRLGDMEVGGQPAHMIVRDAVSRTIRGTYLSGLLNYPFDEIWDHPAPEDIWQPVAPTRAPAPEPTNVPTPQPTPARPGATPRPTPNPTTGAPSAMPTETHEFNVVFMGTKDYLANGATRDMFEVAFSEMVDVDDSGPVRIGLSQIDNFGDADLELPPGLDKKIIDWVVLQEHLDYTSAPEDDVAVEVGRGASLHDGSLAGAMDIHENLVGAIGAQTMFLMPFGGIEGYNTNMSGAAFGDFTTHTNALWDAYTQYLNSTSATNSSAYLAPAGLVVETIYMDLMNNDKDPLEKGTLFRELYEDDGITPSEAGRYLIGVTLAASMSGWDPTNPRLENSGKLQTVSVETADQIRDAVARTITATIAEAGLVYPWGEEWSTRAPVAPVAVQTLPHCSSPTNCVFSGPQPSIGGAPAPAPTYQSIGGAAPKPTYAAIGAAPGAEGGANGKSAQVEAKKEKPAVSHTTEEEQHGQGPNSLEEQVGPDSESNIESPDLGGVLGLSSARGTWFWQSMLLVGQAAFAWILLQ